MKTFYHATSFDNLDSILENGLKSYGDCVYMTENEVDSVKFLAIRLIPKIVTLKIRIKEKDMNNVHETFDHSQRYFGCRAFGYYGDIEVDRITVSKVYDNPLFDTH